MKTLLYLASGGYYPEYELLPFDRLIFVDRSHGYAKSYPKHNPRIRFIAADALIAIDMLKKEGVKIDCLVSLNEGLNEGGGTYPIFSSFLMGYLSPLLNDKITLVCDLNYYVSKFKILNKLDWGFKKNKKLSPAMPEYINPALFSYSQHKSASGNFGNVFIMEREKSEISFYLPDSLTKIKIIHGSIWEDEQILDMIGLNLLSKHSLYDYNNDNYTNHNKNNKKPEYTKINTVDQFFNAKPKVMDINGKSFSEIMEYCEEKGYKHIGITPWNKGNYQDVINYLKNFKDKPFNSITFYHLNKKDFKGLREFDWSK
jgi:hypothetical protein